MVSVNLLAEFVEEGLAGLGVLDDVDELIHYVYKEDGLQAARDTMVRYNNAMQFVNNTLGKDLRLITEEEFRQYTTD